MLRLHTEAALWQAGVGAGGSEEGSSVNRGRCLVTKDTVPHVPGGRLREPTAARTPDREEGHSWGPSAWHLGEDTPPAHTKCQHALFLYLLGCETHLFWVYTRNDFSWCSFHGRCQKIEEERQDSLLLALPPGFGIVNLVMSPFAIGKGGGFS